MSQEILRRIFYFRFKQVDLKMLSTIHIKHMHDYWIIESSKQNQNTKKFLKRVHVYQLTNPKCTLNRAFPSQLRIM